MIKIKPLHPDVEMPTKGTAGSAAVDLRAYLVSEKGHVIKTLVPSRSTRAIPIGIAIEVPADHAAFIISRSGLAVKHSIFVANSPGLIDPDYRGELQVLLYNGSHESYWVQHGDRVAQLLVVKVAPLGTLFWNAELSPTERGEKGMGSTGR